MTKIRNFVKISIFLLLKNLLFLKVNIMILVTNEKYLYKVLTIVCDMVSSFFSFDEVELLLYIICSLGSSSEFSSSSSKSLSSYSSFVKFLVLNK